MGPCVLEAVLSNDIGCVVRSFYTQAHSFEGGKPNGSNLGGR